MESGAILKMKPGNLEKEPTNFNLKVCLFVFALVIAVCCVDD
jgi:hypothetical protein